MFQTLRSRDAAIIIALPEFYHSYSLTFTSHHPSHLVYRGFPLFLAHDTEIVSKPGGNNKQLFQYYGISSRHVVYNESSILICANRYYFHFGRKTTTSPLFVFFSWKREWANHDRYEKSHGSSSPLSRCHALVLREPRARPLRWHSIYQYCIMLYPHNAKSDDNTSETPMTLLFSKSNVSVINTLTRRFRVTCLRFNYVKRYGNTTL